MCAQSGACGPDFREARDPELISKNPPGKGGSAYRPRPEDRNLVNSDPFRLRRFLQVPILATGEVCPGQAASGRVALQPGGSMLAFVPVAFDVYRPLKPRLRWAMQCLVSFADHAGRCFPSIRTFALHAGVSRSAAQRDLADLAAAGLVTRRRRPGGVYVYRIGPRFLPKWPKRKVSQARDWQIIAASDQRSDRSTGAVPVLGTKENSDKKNQGWARKRAQFAKPEMINGGLPDETDRWKARIRSWLKSRFWLPDWGPRPDEPGCWAPLSVLSVAGRGG